MRDALAKDRHLVGLEIERAIRDLRSTPPLDNVEELLLVFVVVIGVL